MNSRKQLWVAMAALITVAPAFAADATPAGMDAAMAQAMKLGTPGDAHKVLDPLAGKFNVTVRFWMKPGDKAQESKGASENTWILGGRFLQQKYSGSMMGQPFEGVGITGYDNVRGEYQSTWIDNAMTGIMSSSGSWDAKTKTLSQSGKFACPMTGEKDRWFRTETKIKDKDTFTYTSFSHDPSGKEMKDMEITYVRAK